MFYIFLLSTDQNPGGLSMFRTLVLQKQLEVLIKGQRMLVTAPLSQELSNCHMHTLTHSLECSRTLLTLDSLHSLLSTSHLCCVCLLKQSVFKSSLKA